MLGNTPLIEAAENDAFEAVRFLVARGADINLVSREGFNFDSPLTAAARKGNAAMVNYLIQLGANPNVAVRVGMMGDNSTKTAFDFAAGKPEVIKALQSPASPEQIAKNVQFIKFMMSAGDLAAAEKHAEAIAEFNRALEIFPDSSTIFLRQIPVLLTMKSFDAAAAIAQKTVDVCAKQKCGDATKAEAHNYRAVALIRQQKFADAFADANKAVEFCTKSEKPCNLIGSAYNNRGVILREQKQFNEAVADLTKSIEAMPTSARPFFHRARTFYLLGDYDRATADLIKARELDSSDEEIKAFQITRDGAAKNKTNSTN